MNPFDSLNRKLSPLGGTLRIDTFAEQVEVAKMTSRAAEDAELPGASGSAGRTATERGQEPREERRRQLTDTGRLRLEVLEFMNRQNPSKPDDDEIHEFMQERGGFDPSQRGPK